MLATSYGRDLWSEADINLRGSDVCYGSKADLGDVVPDVRYGPEAEVTN